MQTPKYNPGDKVIVRDGTYGAAGEVRGATVLSVWYNHKDGCWRYAVSEGSAHYMHNSIPEKDVLDVYTPAKLLHYARKGL